MIIKGRCGHEPAKFWIFRLSAGRGAVYLHLPQRWQSAFLLAASWVFYALAMPSMLPVTIAIAVFTYLCGRGMTAREGARKTAFLRIGVVGLLAILAFLSITARSRRTAAGRPSPCRWASAFTALRRSPT